VKFTLTDCMARINQALNYPSISYEDVSHFFDQAIAELNSSLRIGVPTVTEMRFENTLKVTDHPNTVICPTLSDDNILVVTQNPTVVAPSGLDNVVYYASKDVPILQRSLYIKKDGAWKAVESAYAVSAGVAYEAVTVASTYALWREVPVQNVLEFDLLEYLPMDWWILFVIPYVCFKATLRDGGNGALFSDEFTQGFQQIQTSYGVPNTVVLSTVAHKPAYRDIVMSSLHNLDRRVTTRAVFDSMRLTDGVGKVYGENLFDNGGWGI
jgi:hypothetical protein